MLDRPERNARRHELDQRRGAAVRGGRPDGRDRVPREHRDRRLQLAPTATDLAGGGFVVSWQDSLDDVVKAQLYAADGSRVGQALVVNTIVNDNQGEPTVAPLADGGFVVSWRDHSGTLGDDSESGIKA